VVTFADPNGTHNAMVKRVVASHFQLALGTPLGACLGGVDRYDLPRVPLGKDVPSTAWMLARHTRPIQRRSPAG
jgi:hypothetical protein